MSSGSELAQMISLGRQARARAIPLYQGCNDRPSIEGFSDLEWIETDDCEADIQKPWKRP